MSDIQKTFRHGPFEFTPLSLKAVDSYDESDLIGLGAHCRRLGNAVQWWYGDWYAMLEQRCDERAAELAEKLKFSPRTIEMWGRVSTVFPAERRRDLLTWSHHRILMSLPKSEQERLLDMAERKEMSEARLGHFAHSARERLKALSSGEVPTSPIESNDDEEETQEVSPSAEEKKLSEDESADLRIRKYKLESDKAKMRQASEDTSLVRVTLVQIKALLDQVADWAEQNKQGQFMNSAAFTAAWHNVNKALRPGIPYGVCGSCGGGGKMPDDSECDLCRGMGWLSRGRYMAQKDQFKI